VRARETLVPLLVLPAVTPVMLGGTRAFEAALDGATGDGWPWVQLLAAFAVLVVTGGALAFGPLLEESS
jgi:heme exporter protein B